MFIKLMCLELKKKILCVLKVPLGKRFMRTIQEDGNKYRIVKMSQLPSVSFPKMFSQKEFTISVSKHLMEITHPFGLKRKDLRPADKVSQ